MPITFQDGPDTITLLRAIQHIELGGSHMEGAMLAEALKAVINGPQAEAAAQQKVAEAVEAERARMQVEMETKIAAIAAEANMQVGILVNDRLRQQKEMSDATGHDILAPIDLSDAPISVQKTKRNAAHAS